MTKSWGKRIQRASVAAAMAAGLSGAATPARAQGADDGGTKVWTVDEVTQHLLSDPQLQQLADSFIYTSPADGDAAQKDLFARYTQIAGRMNINPVPELYIDNYDQNTVPSALSQVTQGGTPYIIYNRAAGKEWTPEELLTILAQELAQFKHREVTPQRMTELLNDARAAIAAKFADDAEGAGQNGTCNPEALASALTKQREEYIKAYMQLTGVSREEAANNYDGLVSDPRSSRQHPPHPRVKDRVDRLAQQASAGECPQR